MQPVLWHIRFSHFAEKVRWALDWKGIPHVRRALLPGLHIPRIMLMSGQPMVPVLSLDGRTISDSTRIIAALEERYPTPALYPAEPGARARALALEDFFDEELGHYLRRFMLQGALSTPGSTPASVAFITAGFGPATRLAFRALSPAFRAFVRWRFDVTEATAEVAHTKVLAALDRIEAELQPSGYLVGDAFSVADLTAAALFAPLAAPPGYPFPAPGLGAVARLRDAASGRKAFQWIHDMYRRHRGASMDVAADGAEGRPS